MDGIYDLFSTDDSDVAKERADALQSMLRGNQTVSGLAALSGSKAFQPIAQQAGQMAHQQSAELASAGGLRLKLAMHKAEQQAALQQRQAALQQHEADRKDDQAFRHSEGALNRTAMMDRRMVNPMASGDMSPEGIDILANIVGSTGDDSILKSRALAPHIPAITKRIAEMYPDFNPAAAKSDYKADSASLSKLQQTVTAINAFENTAKKNLGLVLDAAKGVTDTGIPLLNGPIRSAQRALGSKNVVAFEDARKVALIETAKVITQASLAGVLSDNARHEAENLISGDATLPQIQRAHDIIMGDMENRRTSTAAEVQNIQGRIRGKQPAARAPAGGTLGAPLTQVPESAPAAPRRRKFNPATGALE